VTGNNLSVVPSGELNPEPGAASERVPDYNDEQAYQTSLTQWITGDGRSRQDARHYFWRAFLNSDVIDVIEEIEQFGAGSRSTRRQFRKARRFMIGALLAHESNVVFEQVLELMIACRSGDPRMLAESLRRYTKVCRSRHDWQVCCCFGELAWWPHASVYARLTEHAAANSNWNIRFHALLAVFKSYVRTEGLARVNKNNPGRSYTREVAPLIAGLTEEQQLICMIAFVSQICDPGIGYFPRAMDDEFTMLASDVERLCKGPSFASICAPVSEVVRNLQRANDYVGVCLLLADQFEAACMHPIAGYLLTAACRGWVVAAQHTAAARNLAACLLRKGEFASAFQIADQLATRNPEDMDLQIFAIQVLANTPSAGGEALQRIARIRAEYKITAAQLETLLAFEDHLSQSSA
jgi:hypothetical protein